MKILIIGGAGYIGSQLSYQLSKNTLNKVIVVDKLIYNQGPLVAKALEKCQFFNYDIDEIPDSLINSSDIIINLAAYVGMPICDKFPKEAWRVNTEAVYRLVNKLSSSQYLCFPCTNSGYGSQDDICTEKTPMSSISLYGKSKEEAEKIVMSHPNSTSLRLATLWGPSYRHRIDLMVNYFVYHAVIFGEMSVFQGNYKRNFIHILDVVDAIEEILRFKKHSAQNQIFNLGCDIDNTDKMGLISKIQSFVPEFKISHCDQEDKDKRNYNVSSENIRCILGIEAKRTLGLYLPQLIEYYKMFPAYDTQAHKDILQFIKNV